MTLNAKIGGLMDFLAPSAWTSLYHSQGGATVLALVAWRSYSTPVPVSTAMGDCLRVGTVIGFRASREHYLKFLVFIIF